MSETLSTSRAVFYRHRVDPGRPARTRVRITGIGALGTHGALSEPMHSSTRFHLVLAFVSLVLATSTPSRTAAQALSPAEAAAQYPPASPYSSVVLLDSTDAPPPRGRGRRIAGLTLVTGGVSLVGVMALAGIADDHCDHSDSWACLDGPALWGIAGAVFASPLILTGIILTARGYRARRRERGRVAVQANAGGLRLRF